MQSIPIEIDAHIPVTSTTAANGDAAAGNGMNHAKTHERNESNGSQNSSTTDDHIYANTSILNGLPSEQSTVAVSSKVRIVSFTLLSALKCILSDFLYCRITLAMTNPSMQIYRWFLLQQMVRIKWYRLCLM